MDDLDRRRLARALELAERGRGAVEPNPLVGAVVATRERILAEGFHRRFGGPHAEVDALDQINDQAQGATLYVTLEPCCHHGKTPPCTDRVLRSGVKRVVVGMLDPFPLVGGRAIQLLRDAGVTVEVSDDPAAARLNAPYLKLLKRGRPFVHAKWAMSLDGKIATSAGESKWITGEDARAHAHAFRGLVDGVVVGIRTAIADDPLLTARPAGPRLATRVVIDAKARLPLESQLVTTARDVPLLLATTAAAPEGRRAALAAAGVEVLVLPSEASRVAIAALLDELGRRQWTNLLVEGGAGILGGFLEAKEIDAARVYVAGAVIGGAAALSPIGGTGWAKLADAARFDRLSVIPVGNDLFLSAERDLILD